MPTGARTMTDVDVLLLVLALSAVLGFVWVVVDTAISYATARVIRKPQAPGLRSERKAIR